MPSYSWTEEPDSAVPDIVGVWLFVVCDVVVILGADGGAISSFVMVHTLLSPLASIILPVESQSPLNVAV